MGKRLVFVSGDIGGARAQLPVIKRLIELGQDVEVVADAAGKGCDVWQEAKIDSQKLFSARNLKKLVQEGNLFFVGTCATASDLEIEVIREVDDFNTESTRINRFIDEMDGPWRGRGFCELILSSDGFFNHGFKKWQEVTPKNCHYWFAINDGHAQVIRSLRLNLYPENVKVVGQPAFDVVLDLLPRKEEIRKQRRQELELTDADTLVVWWSAGMDRIIQEDVDMVECALDALSVRPNVVFVPRIHPKLDNTVKADCVTELRNRLQAQCSNRSIKVFSADKMPGEELNLAADLILSVTSTEDIKSVLIGGPPVVHFVGPVTQKWFEGELFLQKPYLPDLISNQALVAYHRKYVPDVIYSALKSDTREKLLANWQPPREKATDKVVSELLKIAG